MFENLTDKITGIFDHTPIDFIELDSFLIISLSTVIFSYIGAGVTFITNITLLKNIFSITLLAIGLTILFY